jgi:hypothetical protein
MAYYAYGVATAFVIGAYRVIVNTSHLLSAKTENLKHVGLYYSCSSGQWVQGKSASWKYVVYLVYTLLVAPLFSWLWVGSFALMFALGKARQARIHVGAIPERVRAAQLRLEQPGLTKDEVTEISAAITEAQGGEVVAEPLDLGARADVTANRTKRRLIFSSHTDDWLGSFSSVYEYRLRGSMVEVRLIDDIAKWPGETTEAVRDGVVMEGVVRKVHGLYSSEDRLAKLKTDTEWHPLDGRVRFYVLAQHPEEVSRPELRRAVREEIEGIRRNAERACAVAREHGFPVAETDAGFEIAYPNRETITPDMRNELSQRLDRAVRAAGLAGGLNDLSLVSQAKAMTQEYAAFLR